MGEDEAGENVAPDQSEETLISAADAGGTSSNATTYMLEKLLSEDEDGDLGAGTPYWGEDLQELVGELGFL